jgi:hypothetical protein
MKSVYSKNCGDISKLVYSNLRTNVERHIINMVITHFEKNVDIDSVFNTLFYRTIEDDIINYSNVTKSRNNFTESSLEAAWELL